jgi:hypothetical protein
MILFSIKRCKKRAAYLNRPCENTHAYNASGFLLPYHERSSFDFVKTGSGQTEG